MSVIFARTVRLSYTTGVMIRTLCEGLGVPVCPSSRKLEYGYTAIYFLETMEWLEEMGIEYKYFINIDSDALFIQKRI